MAAKKSTATKSSGTKRGSSSSSKKVELPENVVLEGNFVTVEGGEHDGRYGVALLVGEKRSIVRTRDQDTARLDVPTSSLRPAVAGRR